MKKNRTQTLKRKILTPMILLIVLVPVITLLFFNIAMRIYMQKASRSDLKAAMLPIETLARQELGDIGESPLSEAKLENAAIRLTQAVQSSKLTEARLLIYNGSDRLAYPKNLPDGFVTAKLAKKISLRLRVTNLTDRVEQVGSGGDACLITGFTLTDGAGNAIFIVLVNRQGAEFPIIRIVNILLLIIMLAGILFGVFVVTRLSDRVSGHVRQICRATERIGSGDFSQSLSDNTGIEEFSQLTRSIERMSNRLEGSTRAQRDFLQNASHELRTPLMSIQGYAEGISGGIVPDTKEAAQIIAGECRHLTAIVEGLLTLSRIESRSFGGALSVLSLRDLLPEFIQRLGGIAVKQNKTVTLSLPEGPVDVSGEEELLGHTMMNIVSNCLRYAKTRVEITATADGGFVLLHVRDDGPGISPEDLPHLFERFYKGRGGNYGLGLAIAKSAAEHMGGELYARNTENGAEFTLRLILISDKSEVKNTVPKP